MKRTALAQLVEMYAECRGVTSTKELADATGYSQRAIRKAKAELGCRNHSSAGTPVPELECRNRNHSSATPGTGVQSPRARISYTEEISNNNKHNTTELASSENPTADENVVVDDFVLQKKLRDAAANQPLNHFCQTLEIVEPIRDLINEGYDLDAQILPTIRKHKYAGHGLISSWKYFVPIVRAAHASKVSGKPKPVRYAQEEWAPGELVTSYVN